MNGETAVQRHDSLQARHFGKIADLAEETFRFVFDGHRYALHLNQTNATKFRQLMEGFVEAAEHYGAETGWAAVLTDDNAPVLPPEALLNEVGGPAVQPTVEQTPVTRATKAVKTVRATRAAVKKTTMKAPERKARRAPVREARVWLREQGFELSDNGRIKDELLQAYTEAMQGDVRRLQELKKDPRFSRQAVEDAVQKSDLDLRPEAHLRSVPPVRFTAEK